MMFVFLLIFVAWQVFGLLIALHWAIDGRDSAEPTGLFGVVFIILYYGAEAIFFWKSGVFAPFGLHP